MKKVSAFSILKGKKEKDTVSLERTDATRGSMKKASSTPAINNDEESTSKKLLRAFKGGSFRDTIRGNKHRPKTLADGKGDSPFVAGDGTGVKLTGVKDKDKKGDKNINVTPVIPKKKIENPVKQTSSQNSIQVKSSPKETPKLPQNIAKNQVTPKSTIPSKPNREMKNLPPVPTNSMETPKINSHTTNGDHTDSVSAHTKKGKRPLDDVMPSSSASKKRKTDSIGSPHNEKSKKKRIVPTALLETMYDSSEDAKKVFECMIHPVQADKFFKELWQKKPLFVRRHDLDYNNGWFSTAELDRILEQEHIEFGVNLDITSYRDGKRETHNPPGRAYKSVVWDYYQNGCSVRMLNPQTYCKNVWKMLSTLQEYFNCCCGANIYLTPPGTQGFAPHYDDIEAFILQLEGKKRWRLYNPRSNEETLPRESSGNFDESEIGQPILDITLCAGDLLYFPRGTIHQGNALDDAHSLHITFSCYQKNTWGDLLHKLLPRCLDIAIEEDISFREGLPLDYLHYMGLAHSDVENPKRDEFIKKITSLMTTMIQNYSPVDAACDQMGKQVIIDSLPPVLTDVEKSCSIHGHGEKWDDVRKCVKGNMEVEPDTMVKLIRKGCLRLVREDDNVCIYHNLENARVYHGREPQFIEISPELAPAVEFLLHSYPEYVSVDSLPSPSVDENVEIASVLYDKGLLITGEPLESVHVDDSDDDDKCVINDDDNF